jgi:hypothetical protein
MVSERCRQHVARIERSEIRTTSVGQRSRTWRMLKEGYKSSSFSSALLISAK